MDYEEEMEGLNNPSNSPLRSAYEKVMKAPPASTETQQVKEKQNLESPQTAIPDPSPIDDTTAITQSPPH